MEKIKILFAHKIFKIFMWAFLVLLGLFVILVIVRAFHFYNLDKTNAQVGKIHATKLQLSDVMGDNLPPDPGVDADKTVAGVDANQNGIRDDVELAVFKEYPNSAKTRAVLLQYALVLQMQMTLPIINKEIATAISEADSRAFDCIGQIVTRGNGDIQKIESYRKFVEDKQLDLIERKNIKDDFDRNSGSFELQSGCDINLTTLLN
jgi:hypothetical protein